MKLVHYTFTVLSLLLVVTLTGCGDGNSGVPEGSKPSAYFNASSQGCIDCHSAASTSVVITAKIAEEWGASNHNTSKSGKQYGAGCVDCHEPEVGHPGSCNRCHGGTPSATNIIGTDVIRNPDEQSKCYKCHNHSREFHYSRNATEAEFVTKNNLNKCRNCHNPHDVSSLMSLNKDWHVSGHGNTNSPAWTDRDFKTNPICIRCHTATGFTNFLNSGFTTPFPSQSWATPGDDSREVLSCDACHSNYDFINSVRKTKPFVAPYNNNLDKKAFPDVGYSNLCIACHSGRESMATILAMSTMSSASASTSGFKNSHYMAAAGMMYMTTGFTDFTVMTTRASDTYTYGESYLINNVNSTHRKLGTSQIVGDNHNTAAFVAGSYDSNGPCVTCHLNATGQTDRKTSHTFAINGNAFNQVCKNCHISNGSTFLTSVNFKTAFVDKKSLVFQNAINLAIKLLNDRYGIKYDEKKYPYFFEANGSGVTNWKRNRNDAEAKRLMGACYNINLLKRDPAAFVHGRVFAQRLIYDTIDYLDDGNINMSTGATAIANYPLIYVKGTLPANSSASYAYLRGYNITTGVWNSTYERP